MISPRDTYHHPTSMSVSSFVMGPQSHGQNLRGHWQVTDPPCQRQNSSPLKFLMRRHFNPAIGSFLTVQADIGAEGHGGSCLDVHVNNVNNVPNDSEYPEFEEVTKVYGAIGIPLHCRSKENHRYPMLILVERDSFWERVGVSFLDSWRAVGPSPIKLEKRKIRLG
jgi:hypothetical protein